MPFPQAPPPLVVLADGLSLRELTPADAPAVAAAVDANREHLRAWLPWVDSSLGPADSLAFLEGLARNRSAGLTLAWGLWQHDSLCGVIGLHDISAANSNLQIGYWIARDAEGRGLMTSACRAILRIAFDTLQMERVEIRCAAGNRRSCAIPERLGFSFEGVLRHAQRLRGEFVDLRLYSLLRSEFGAQA
jgi:ribosomal-protein-serine acetyltransferase